MPLVPNALSLMEFCQIAAWQKKKNHTIAEEFIKPVAKLRTNMLLGKKTEQVISKITLLNDFIYCHIWMADDVKEKLSLS